MMNTHPDILPDATIYMQMSCIGVPLVAVYNYTSSMLRALGDSRTPLYFLIFSCFLNLGLDMLFVCVFEMGVFSTALATFAGQNYGARNTSRVKEGLKHGMLISTIFTLLIMVAYQLLADVIIGLFVKETSVIEIGAQALRLTSWFYIFLSTIYMCRGILNGVGDALFAVINGVVEVICRIGLPMLIVLIPGTGLWGIWWTAGLTWIISAIFCLLRYISWRRKAVIDA